MLEGIAALTLRFNRQPTKEEIASAVSERLMTAKEQDPGCLVQARSLPDRLRSYMNQEF